MMLAAHVRIKRLPLCYRKQPSLQKKPVDNNNTVAHLDQLAPSQIYFTGI